MWCCVNVAPHKCMLTKAFATGLSDCESCIWYSIVQGHFSVCFTYVNVCMFSEIFYVRLAAEFSCCWCHQDYLA